MRLSLIKKFERAFFVLFLAAFVFLVYMAGMLSAYYDTGGYQWIKDAMVGRSALLKKEKGIARSQRQGNKANATGKHAASEKLESRSSIFKDDSYKGYTLFTSPAGSKAVLINMNGEVVHQWDGKFSSMFPHATQVDHPVPDGKVFWRDAYLYPNGDLLAVHEAKGDTPYGYGLVKVDKNSNMIWRYSSNTHHKLDIGSDGKIYALTHSITHRDIPGLTKGKAPVLEDFVAILSPEGKELVKISLLEAIANSPYHDYFQISWKGDALHTNNVDVLDPKMADKFPMFKPGQILFSFRNPSTVAVLDVASRKIVWAAKGPWKKQHNAKFRADGTIMMFDNKGGGRNHSRILQYSPETKKVNVLYEGSAGHSFASSIRGMEQALPNGNMLITESQKGRIFEINEKKDIVWEFKNPYRKHSRPILITTAWRFGEKDLTFLDKEKYPAVSSATYTTEEQDKEAKRIDEADAAAAEAVETTRAKRKNPGSGARRGGHRRIKGTRGAQPAAGGT
jgi:hypothetical protein